MSGSVRYILFTVMGALVITAAIFYAIPRHYKIVSRCSAGGAYSLTPPPPDERNIISTGTQHGLPFWIFKDASSDNLDACPDIFSNSANATPAEASPAVPAKFRIDHLIIDLVIWGAFSSVVLLVLAKIRKRV